MTSTTHKNSVGNYEAEQKRFQRLNDYDLYEGRSVNKFTCLPGDGLLNAKYHPSLLSHNSIDIESQLLGIGSTNLVNKKPIILPKIKELKTLSIYQKRDIVQLPELLKILPNQRPFNV